MREFIALPVVLEHGRSLLEWSTFGAYTKDNIYQADIEITNTLAYFFPTINDEEQSCGYMIPAQNYLAIFCH